MAAVFGTFIGALHWENSTVCRFNIEEFSTTRMKIAFVARHLAISLSILLLAYSTPAEAQRCGATCANPQSLLGLTEQYLLASIPELRRVQKPVRGPRNSLGKWILLEVYFATQPFSATYFVKGGLVSRIEFVSSATKAQCDKRLPFDRTLAELRKEFGDGPVSGSFSENGRATQTVTFSNKNNEVSLHLSTSTDECSTRLIYKNVQIKDGSAL